MENNLRARIEGMVYKLTQRMERLAIDAKIFGKYGIDQPYCESQSKLDALSDVREQLQTILDETK